MNTTDLLRALDLHESIIVLIHTSQVKVLKSRLSNLRSRQQAKLAEFSDDNRLEYKELPLLPEHLKQQEETGKPVTRLRISLIARTAPIKGLVEVVNAEEF